MQTNLRKIQRKRIFSEDLRKQAVNIYEKGEMTVLELSKHYEVSDKSIYNWIYKYSKLQKKSIQIVEMSESNTSKIKSLEAKIKELERAVGVKQMNIDFLEEMISLAKEEYDIDVKKNYSTPQSTSSEKRKKN